jgi:uncharacterized protein with HEPN domain
MTRQRAYTDYLRDMLAYAADAEQFVAGMTYDQFLTDRKTQYAVTRALEVIGEAATHIPDEVRQRSPAVPWRQIIGMRNVLIHGYVALNLEMVWKTVQDDLPALKPQLAQLLTDAAGDEPSGG